MLTAPLAIAMFSTIFSSLGLIKADAMNSVNVFTILGLIVWAVALGVKIWETALVWRFIEEVRKNEKSTYKVNFYPNKVELTVLNF